MTTYGSIPQDTDREVLLEQLEAAKAHYDKTGNLWVKFAIVALLAELERGFDDEGAEIPITKPDTELAIQFSPEEAVNAEGWQTVHAKGYGKLPRWLRNTDLSSGLDISRNRSNGCFIIRNEREIANAWVNDPKAAADSISRRRASPRVCLLAGTMMQGYRYMLPSYNLSGATIKIDDYAFDPDIPFTEEERVAFKENFSRYHIGGGAFVGAHLQRYGKVVQNGVEVDLSGMHRVLTVANHPQWILPGAIEHWNTPLFLRKTYYQAQLLALNIDAGGARVPGYTTPEQWGGGTTPAQWRKWRAKKEIHGRKGLPFRLGA